MRKKTALILIVCVLLCATMVYTAQSQTAPAGNTRGGAMRGGRGGFGGFGRGFGGGRGGNTMVSMTPPINVTRIKLYEKTPNVIEGTENELNPMEPTLDLYIPDTNNATGAGVLLCPGGGYLMLTVPGEGGTIAEFFKSHNVAAFVLRYRHGPQYHYPTTLLDAQRALRLISWCQLRIHFYTMKLVATHVCRWKCILKISHSTDSEWAQI